MICLILAAGYATRLYPLTENFPKPLLKIGDKTIVDWLVDDIASSGEFDQFVIISNDKFAKLLDAWGQGKEQETGYKFTLVNDGTRTNETRLGAVKDIQLAMDSLPSQEDLLIVAGDNVLDFSLTRFVDYAKEKNTSCIMRYYEDDINRLRKCGVAEIDENDRVVSLEEKPAKPRSHWCTPPFYFYKAQDAAWIGEAIADGCGTDAPGSLVAWMCRHTIVHSMEMPGRRYDIGDIKSYDQVQKEYKGIVK